VLVVGDVMLDEHLWGSGASLSSEAGAPVVEVETAKLALGGAGNTAANAIGLGAQTHLVAAPGRDEAGDIVRELAARLGVQGCFVTSTTRPTPRKSRVYSDDRLIVRFDHEVRAPIEPSDEARLTQLSVDLLGEVDVLIVSDYAKGTVTESVARTLMTEARRLHTPAVVDTKAHRPSAYRGCTAMTPQVRELASWVGRNLVRDDYAAAARLLAEQLQCPLILLTEGKEGMTLFSADASWHLAPRTAEAVSSLGAGDAVVAAFALGLAAGLAPVAAAELANDAAGVVVQRRGTHPVSITALRQLLQRGSHAAARVD
jgi:D-beta-D-heptose 7-phosphate kinase/D-beta-D-heptose 1-phosphate adenosyltransferase